MRRTVAKRLSKRAHELWAKACKEHKHLARNNGRYRRINVLKYQKGKETLFETATVVVLGARRLYKNLKWQWKRGLRSAADEQLALDNAIKWSTAK